MADGLVRRSYSDQIAEQSVAEEQLRAAVDAAELGIWDWDIEHGLLHWSDRMRALFGVGPEETVTYEGSFLAALHPDDRPIAEGLVEASLADVEGEYRANYRINTLAEGRLRWIEATGRCYFDDGRPVRLIGTARDITAAKVAEDFSDERNLLLSLTQEAVGVGIWEFDLPDGFANLDRLSREMHGLRPDHSGRLTQEEWAALLKPEDARKAVAAFQKAIEDDTVYDVIFQTIGDGTSDGSRWIHGLARALYRSDGRPYRMIGLNIDVTERKKAELELIRLHEEVLRTSRLSAMGALAATFAHELNQPLTSVSNYLACCRQALAEQDPQLESLEEFVERGIRQAQRAGEIIRRIRKFTLSGEVSTEHVLLSALLDNAWRDISRHPEMGNIQVERRFPPDFMLTVDPVQMGQVLINLLRNSVDALQFTEEPKIVVSASESGSAIRLTIEDNGSGIAFKTHEELFEPFRTTKSEGTGLGLPICRTIVEMHGGKIWAEEAVPCGARMVISLPLVSEETSRSASATSI